MQPPRFWHRPPGFWSTILSPLGALYAFGTSRRLARGTALKLGIPVICIGNINAGGTGKTPTVIAVAQRLQAMGFTPHIVSRGYGGTLESATRVDERKHSADEVGDEPLLLAAFAPVWVSPDRAQAAKLAEQNGADVVILDDGFQNPSLHKDLSIVVVDAARGFGNGKVLPAGPLREPVQVGLARADLLLSIGPNKAQSHFLEVWGTPPCPHLMGRLAPLQTGMDWQGSRVLAFAGIGHPQKFFATVRELGAEIVKEEPLEDHQPLSQALMLRLENEAMLLGAQLVTTEKDATRLPDAFRAKVLTVPVRLEIEDWSALDKALTRLF
ncbi:tetraacyldisaccharide 4'-kinase [Litoreibacter arenae]|uniref:Tetraacyldisaccharide 4'-kinase n=1 Tax=Litoreibacter arenae DSM 19593 TaxID=1123360 RepID=S9RV06_9RHOB|nr:tetraacyldisaccharide 4'-kinase [Litoreibacter arenae]EPX77789.1 Tetraacyldisaccharide 4'-kinase [Litoreibacter arenae DSM 19593]